MEIVLEGTAESKAEKTFAEILDDTTIRRSHDK